MKLHSVPVFIKNAYGILQGRWRVLYDKNIQLKICGYGLCYVTQPLYTPVFYKQSIFDPRPENCLAIVW